MSAAEGWKTVTPHIRRIHGAGRSAPPRRWWTRVVLSIGKTVRDIGWLRAKGIFVTNLFLRLSLSSTESSKVGSSSDDAAVAMVIG
jgi:hypothetical protein